LTTDKNNKGRESNLRNVAYKYVLCLREITLGPTQSPNQWVPGSPFSGEKAAVGVKLTTHLHEVPRLKTRGVTLHFPVSLDGVMFD